MKRSGLLLYLLLLLSFSISGQILNRSFEFSVPADPNGPGVYFNSPIDWSHKNYTGVHSQFFPVTERGEILDWSITEPAEGDYFLVMTTGNMGPGSDGTITEAKVWQRIFLPAWTLVRGVYYFGTGDYRPYNDYGAIRLIPFNDPNSPCDPNDPNDPNTCPPPRSVIELAHCSVSDVNDFGSTERWIPFSYTISPQQEGSYDLVMFVTDGTDFVYESYFAVDDLSICGPLTPLGDLTRDCRVNMEDVAVFSNEWMEVCSIDPNFIPDPNDPDYISDPKDPNYIDPNNLNDPNCVCADFSRDNKVDVNDLYPLQDNWLINDL
jgi:hypothetical protein